MHSKSPYKRAMTQINGRKRRSSSYPKKVNMKEVTKKGLMFVDATINSQPRKSTLVDSDATHKFHL